MMSWRAAYHAVCTPLLVSLMWSAALAEEHTSARHPGRILSVRPHTAMLVIEAYGSKERSGLLAVHIGDARVVRTWRDSADLGVRRERVTSIYRWPVGTFVIVIGSEVSMGSIEASRVEIPKVTSE